MRTELAPPRRPRPTDAIARALGALALAATITSPAWAQASHVYPIRGRAVDGDGRPVADLAIAMSWDFGGATPKPGWRSDVVSTPGKSLHTDADGRFTGSIYAQRPTVAIFALDPVRNRGGIGIFARDVPDRELTLHVGPLIRLHGEAPLENADLTDKTRYIYLTDKRALIAIASSISNREHFAFAAPPGDYSLSISAKDAEKVTIEVALRPTDVEVDLGRLPLSPTNLALHYGKEPPAWHLTAARGVDPDTTLAAYRGRWVLIEFWAYW